MRQPVKTVLVGIIFLAGGFFVGATVATFTQSSGRNWEHDYNELLGDYNGLTQEYDDLLDDYNALLNSYTNLFGQYQSILSVLENPLTDPDTPTLDEIFDWLDSDNTDTFEYTENWMCGDFAAMLMTRAKGMNWRMRIACMFWSYNGDDGWQDPTHPYGVYGHAFNVILCQDIDSDGTEDWIYIEPQTDAVWYVVILPDYYVHYNIWLTFTGGISGTIWTEPYYINHYSYFA